MRIIKFKNSEHFTETFDYAGMYCWYLGECNGAYIFAPLTSDREEVELCSNAINIINNGGRVINVANDIIGKDYDLQTSSDVIAMIEEVLPEAFTRTIMNVNDMLYYESVGIEKFIRYNANVKNTKWTADDILNPVRTVGQIFTLYSMQELPLADESIVWLNANKFDSVCETLQRVDAQPLMTSDNSCGCGKPIEVGDTCSALNKYINYKNERTVNDFGNIQFIHKLFFMFINDESVFNNELANELISFAEIWCNETISTLSIVGCPCTEINTERINLVNQLKKAIEFLKEGEESICLHEKFITFWMSSFIKEILN